MAQEQAAAVREADVSRMALEGIKQDPGATLSAAAPIRVSKGRVQNAFACLVAASLRC